MPAFPLPRLFPVRERLANWPHWLPRASLVVLALLLLLQAARLLREMTLSDAIAAAAAPPPVDIAPPPTADLFFRRGTPVASAGGASNQALGYTLYGVRHTAEGGSAILAGTDGIQHSYAVGAELASGIVLAATTHAGVVLTAAGVRYPLELAPPPSLDATALQPAAPGAVLPLPVSHVPTTAVAAAGTTPEAAATTAAEEGYRLVAGAPETTLLRLAGLRPGDVLLSADGHPLNPARLDHLKQALKDRPQLQIQYRRDGQIRSTTVRVPR